MCPPCGLIEPAGGLERHFRAVGEEFVQGLRAVDGGARLEQLEQVLARADGFFLPFRLEVFVHRPALHDRAADALALGVSEPRRPVRPPQGAAVDDDALRVELGARGEMPNRGKAALDERKRSRAAAPPEHGEALPAIQLAKPICFVKSWLSQNSHSWSIVAPFQCPMVAMPIAKRFPVGAMVLPSPAGMGRVKVPVITPDTAVHVPEPKRIG